MSVPRLLSQSVEFWSCMTCGFYLADEAATLEHQADEPTHWTAKQTGTYVSGELTNIRLDGETGINRRMRLRHAN